MTVQSLSNDEAVIAEMAESAFSDFNLSSRLGGNAGKTKQIDLDTMSAQLAAISKRKKVVYTAFDGDHQQLSGLMRMYVISRGSVPANPDSILDYKETVASMLTKRGVLEDDLAVLRGCDELWVFTDLPCDPSAIVDLAEGVVVELLYFLKRKRPQRVCFVPLSSLSTNSGEPVDFTYSYEETKARLDASQKTVLDLANTDMEVDRSLPTVAFYVIDPLDFKYARWLLPRSPGRKRVPLVPNLSIQVSDFGIDKASSGKALVAWAALTRIAGACIEVRAAEMGRTNSVVCDLLTRLWLRSGRPTPETCLWRDYQIPKVLSPASWPLTDKERNGISTKLSAPPRLVALMPPKS